MNGPSLLARRHLLALGLAVGSTPALAASIVTELARGATPIPGKLRLRVPEIVEDGSAVPLSVEVDSPMTIDDHVRAIHIVAALNPEPTVAVFRLAPTSGLAAASTRIRLAESQIVEAIAEMSDGRWYSGRAPVKVALGGCGSGAIRPAAPAGDPRIKLPGQVRAGETFEIKSLLAHPMHTGRQTDLSGALIPRQIIIRFDCRALDGELFHADLGTGIAANPYLAFHARLERTSELEFVWAEESGQSFVVRQTVAVGD